MGGLGALSGRRLLTDAADAAVAAVAASRKRARVDPMTLEELDQDVERFAVDCLAVSHADLFPQVWDDWQQVERLLDARQSLKDRAHLTLLGGRLAYFLARLSFNLGDYAAARRHAVLAWEYAEDVGQPVLCASVRSLQGHHRVLRWPAATVAGPVEGCRTLRHPLHPRADRGQHRQGVRGAWRPAKRRAGAGSDGAPPGGPAGPARRCALYPGTAMSALANTLVRLGDGEAAEAYARQAVALHNLPGVEDTLFEDRGNATLNLATSLVVRPQPEPEEAARLGVQAIAVPHQQRTQTVRTRAVELCRLLDTWRTTPAVKEFAEQLREYKLPASAA